MNQRPTFKQQFIALFKRNILLKKRKLWTLFWEITAPLFLCVTIIVIYYPMIQLKDIEEIVDMIGTGTNWYDDRQQWSFKLYNWIIAPQNQFTDQFITKSKLTVKSMRTYVFKEIDNSFNTSDDLYHYFRTNLDNFLFGVLFNQTSALKVDYTIRMASSKVPDKLFGNKDNCRVDPFGKKYDVMNTDCKEFEFYRQGFTFIQTFFDSTIISILSPNSSNTVVPNAELFLYPKPKGKTTINIALTAICITITFVFCQILPFLTTNLVKEKEKKIKESMFMMGLRPTVYWLSWFALEAILVFGLSLVFAIGFAIIDLIPNNNSLILFLLIFTFGLTLIELSAVFTTFFEKELTSSQTVPIISSLFAIAPVGFAYYVDLPFTFECILSFVSPIALIYGIKSILTITYLNDSTLTFYNIFFGTKYSIAISIVFLVIDNILYALLALYLDRVVPGQYGSKQKLFYCFDKNYWFPQKVIHSNSNPMEINPNIEEVSEELQQKAVIKIQSIFKKFEKQKTFSVNNLSMNIYESQITGLLGHNGAGKTTLINMLVGAIRPTKGTAYIHGYDVTNWSEMYDLRSLFGVCLQENILFDELNSEEHLLFFGEMKGLKEKKLIEEVNQLLVSVDLFENRFTLSEHLSGGQKRKLCIAIALIGNPKVVIMDEPTSGVDPSIRRQIWSIIQSYKSDKTIIITTHSMEEADVLCDRKAIISRGRLKCVGSSMFLKQRFGVGYHLTIDVQNNTNVEDITSLIKSEIQSSFFERFTGFEIYYILPQNESKKFPKLFKVLENRISTKSDIKSFGISMTSLEEVFLKLEDEEEVIEEKSDKSTNKYNVDMKQEISSLSDIQYNPNYFQSLIAYFYIKVLLKLRNPWNLIHLNVAIVMMFAIIFIFKLFISLDSEPIPIRIDPNIYNKSLAILKYKNESKGSLEPFAVLVSQMGVKPELINEISIKSLNNSYMAVIIKNFQKDDIQWQWLFNETYTYSLPILQNLMANIYLNYINNAIDRRIETTNYVFPKTPGESFSQQFETYMMRFLYTYVLVMILLQIAQIFSFETLDDRETKIIEIIRISGMGFMCYWSGNLLIHSLLILFEILLVVILSTLFVRLEFLESLEMIVVFTAHLFLSAICLLLMFYVFLHFFDTKASAQLLFLFLIFPLYGFIMIFAISIVFKNKLVIIAVFLISGTLLPLFSVFIGQLLIVFIGSGIVEINEQYLPFYLNLSFITLIFSVVLYLYLLKIAETLKFGGHISEIFGGNVKPNLLYLPESVLEDTDVVEERRRTQTVYRSKQNIPILLIYGLKKVFFKRKCVSDCFGVLSQPEVAVKNLSLMVEKNSIFGLLGPNGAGKTTTMKLIIKQERQTNGLVWVNGREVDFATIHNQVGYCSQHDTLWKDITIKEHLRLFAAIRGIQYKYIDKICEKHMNDLKISEHANKRTEFLSGGTKRKLCYILSLFGLSKLVLLDEPSTGMDPHSKRFLWTTIQNLFNKNSDKSAVLTTHSMEEANALCTRLAIMTKGVMRCIGSVQHLKDKYGAGYVLDIKWNKSQTKADLVKQIVSNLFTEWKVREEFDNRLTIDIPQHSVTSLSNIFLSLENIKNNSQIGVEEYSFSQTTLEQVFIFFAKEPKTIKV